MIAKKEKVEVFEMIAYRCPYCGCVQMKDLESVRANDTWECLHCKRVFKVA